MIADAKSSCYTFYIKVKRLELKRCSSFLANFLNRYVKETVIFTKCFDLCFFVMPAAGKQENLTAYPIKI